MRLNKAKTGLAERLTIDENQTLADLMKTMHVQEGWECRVATINANGLNDPDKKGALALFLISFTIDVCVVSETHLKQGDLVSIKKYFLEYG